MNSTVTLEFNLTSHGEIHLTQNLLNEEKCSDPCALCNPACGPTFDRKGYSGKQRAALCAKPGCFSTTSGAPEVFKLASEVMCCVQAEVQGTFGGVNHTLTGSFLGDTMCKY